MKSQTVIVEMIWSSPYLVLEATSNMFEAAENSTESICASEIAI